MLSTLAMLVLSFTTVSGRSQEPAQEARPIADKQVLVLPVVNSTGEKWEDLKKRISDEVGKTVVADLTKAGYTVVSDFDPKLIDGTEFNPNDEESWRRDTFYAIGQKSGSQYVVFMVVTNTSQKMRTNFFSAVPEGDVTLKCWIVDAKARSPLISAKSVNAKARSKSNLFGEAKGSECQVEAARRAARDAVAEAFGLKKPK